MDQGQIRRLLEFTYDAAQADDPHEFRHVVTSRIRSVVAADLASYTEVDLNTRRVLAPLDPPDTGIEQLTPLLAQFAHEHPLITRTTTSAETISDYLSARRYKATALYQDFYRKFDADDQIAINLPAQPGVRIGIALNRSRPSFNDHDRAALDLLRPVLSRSFRRAIAREHARALHAQLAEQDPTCRFGVILAGRDGRIEFVDELGRRWLHEYFPPTHGTLLPHPLTEWLQSHNRGDDPDALHIDHGERRLTLHPADTQPGEPYLIELHERNLATDELTTREREILSLVARGKRNQQIADELTLSRRTVENHLQSVYRKLQVNNRTAATAARAANAAQAPNRNQSR